MKYSITYPMNPFRSMRLPNRFTLRPLTGLLLLLAVACSPLTEQEQAYYEERRREQEEEREQERILTDSGTVNEAVEMVKEGTDPETFVTWEDWLATELAQEPGRVMFGRWRVVSRGRGRVQVRYEYTVMGENYEMARKGWGWDANIPLRQVASPRPLLDDELGVRTGGEGGTATTRRSLLDDFSLE